MITILNRRARTDASSSAGYMYGMTRRDLMAASALGLLAGTPRLARAAAPEGQLTWAMHVSVPPTWFDPAETQAIITPYMILYALHDAMVKPMPGTLQAPCLAESWQASEDGTTYDFTIRDGAKFHNGAPVTGEDVKFSFERYRGANQDLLHKKSRRDRGSRRAPRPLQAQGAVARFHDLLFERQRRRLDRPEKICRGGRRRRVQEGPDRRRSVQIRLVQSRGRAGPGGVRRLLAQDAVRQAAGDEGDPRRVDPACRAEGRRSRYRLFDPRRSGSGTASDARPDDEISRAAGDELDLFSRAIRPEITVAQAAGAAGRQSRARPQRAWNKALFLGGCKINNSIIPETFEYYWQPPEAVFDPAKARKLLAEAGYPNGFDAGPFSVDGSYSNIGEVAVEFAAAGRHPHAICSRSSAPRSIWPTPTRN